jgi:hypothetical protein
VREVTPVESLRNQLPKLLHLNSRVGEKHFFPYCQRMPLYSVPALSIGTNPSLLFPSKLRSSQTKLVVCPVQPHTRRLAGGQYSRPALFSSSRISRAAPALKSMCFAPCGALANEYSQ